MNGHVLYWLILFTVLLGAGCDESQLERQRALSDIEGIKLWDLQAEELPQIEALLTFSVLTYTLDADSLDKLNNVFGSLSRHDIRFDNVGAFEANGFVVGTGSHQEGALIAQRLQSIGAVRVSQSSMIIPAHSNEIFYSTDAINPRLITYSTSATGAGGTIAEGGKLGWIIFAEQPEGVPDAVQIMLCPAFWKIGVRDLRIMTGQDPYDFQFFDVARIHFKMEAGSFCLLGPERFVRDQDTLDRLLFEVSGRREKVRFFVIIFGGQRQIDGE